jgi:predicted regulator of Ras-like GTPase activity (Roadblock/LC7/MglB family)
MTESTASGELSWLLRNLGERVAHVRQAVVLSADGLTMGNSQGLDADDADHLSALAAGSGACLAVLADGDADGGLIAYEMTVLVKRVGQHLAANPRFPGQPTTAR